LQNGGTVLAEWWKGACRTAESRFWLLGFIKLKEILGSIVKSRYLCSQKEQQADL